MGNQSVLSPIFLPQAVLPGPGGQSHLLSPPLLESISGLEALGDPKIPSRAITFNSWCLQGGAAKKEGRFLPKRNVVAKSHRGLQKCGYFWETESPSHFSVGERKVYYDSGP